MRTALRRTIAGAVLAGMGMGLITVPASPTNAADRRIAALTTAERAGATPGLTPAVRPTIATRPVTALPALDTLPLQFEANVGQAPADVRYLTRVGTTRVLLTDRDAVLDLRGPVLRPTVRPKQPMRRNASPTERAAARIKARHVAGDAGTVRMQFIGGTTTRPLAEQKLPGVVNYYRGRDPRGWQLGVPTFAQVRYQDVYPGIDVVYYGNHGGLEYDFVLAPGADPGKIRVAFQGVDRTTIAANGDLLLTVAGRTLTQRKPQVYQQIAGARRPVDARYVVGANGDVRFALGAYVASLPLVIDPSLVPLGNGGVGLSETAVGDPSGNTYVTGVTSSTLASPAPAPCDEFPDIATDAFVVKLDAANNQLWTAILGGRVGGVNECSASFGLGIAVDATAANVVVVGQTSSASFVITDGTNVTGTPTAFQTTLADDASFVNDPNNPFYQSGGDGFVVKLTAAGALAFATYLGGSGHDFAQAVTIDSSGNAYVTGGTQPEPTGFHFPSVYTSILNSTQSGGGFSDVFVAKVNPLGSVVSFMTIQGGSGDDAGIGIVVNTLGEAVVTGDTLSFDAPVAAAPPFGTESLVAAADVRPVLARAPLEAGLMQCSPLIVNFPGDTSPLGTAIVKNTPGCDVSNGFLSKFNAASGAPTVAYLVGGSGEDTSRGVAVDASNNVYMAGQTASVDFSAVNPITNAVGNSDPGGGFDAFVVKVALPPPATPTAAPVVAYSSQLGGSGDENPTGIAVTPAGDVFLSGVTTSADTNVLPPATVSVVADPNDPNSTIEVVNADAYLLRIPAPTSTTSAPVVTTTDQTNLGTVDQSAPPPALTITADVDGNVIIAGVPDGTSLGTKITNTITATIDVKPEAKKNDLNLKTRFIEVAILSTSTFDAPARIDQATLTFGKTGDEASFDHCDKKGRKVNKDKLLDLVCTFRVAATNFTATDTVATLKAKTKAGADVIGTDSITVVPSKDASDHDDDSRSDGNDDGND